MGPLTVIELDLAPDVISIARRLEARPGLAVLWSADGSGPSYVAADPVARSASVDPEPALVPGEAGSGMHVPRWIGVLPYEAFRTERPAFKGRVGRQAERAAPHWARPCWFRYGAVAVVGENVAVVGDDAEAARALAFQITRGPAVARRVEVRLHSPEPGAAHAARIRTALGLIGQGELYQVNLARRFECAITGSNVELLRRMGGLTQAGYSALFDAGGVQCVASSPELLLQMGSDGWLRTSPIKGTRPRHHRATADARLASELDRDPKERAELAMILDVERNDLGRLSVPGTVALETPPHVVSHPTVHHRGATLRARLRPGTSRSEVFRTMLPSGSVTGAPKVRAMEVIADLEPHRRGLYTGGIGFISQDGGATLGMGIRTLTRSGNSGHYFAGGGIVADSVPDREVEETLWKAVQLEGLSTELSELPPSGLRTHGSLAEG